MQDFDTEESARQQLRAQRRAKLREKRRRERRRKQILVLSCMGLGVIILLTAGGRLIAGKKKAADTAQNTQHETIEEQNAVLTEVTANIDSDATEQGKDAVKTASEGSDTSEESDISDGLDADMTAGTASADIPFAAGYEFSTTDSTSGTNGEVQSTYALLVDLDDNTIVTQRNARDRINPASMTKIMTVLVAAEHVTDLEDTFTITREITDFSYSNDCSAVGFGENEVVTVKDLLYGTILPSGGDAAAGLACYVAGSMDSFVDMMNQKLKDLGLSDSAHFTNCVGLYNENHYCSIYDMAVILKAAMENELCREVMSAHTYTTSPTEQHPEGIQISNWFLRRIEDKETNGEVVCAKTGYVVQSGNCAASYEVTNSGKHYICVTANAHSGWRCIYDHVEIYKTYTE